MREHREVTDAGAMVFSLPCRGEGGEAEVRVREHGVHDGVVINAAVPIISLPHSLIPVGSIIPLVTCVIFHTFGTCCSICRKYFSRVNWYYMQ